MNVVGSALLWCAIQVTLLGLVATVVYLVARRTGPSIGVRATFGGLLAIVALSLLAFSPWPNWTRPVAPASPLATISSERAIPDVDEQAALDAVGGANQSGAVPRSLETDAVVAETTTDSVPTAGPTVSLPELARALWNELRRIPVETSPDADKIISTADVSAEPSWNWRTVALVLFLGAAALGFVRLLAGLLAVGRLDRRSRPITDASLSETVDILCAKLGCTRPITLRESPELATAATLGWRKPVILLPAAWRTWSNQQQNAVLAHELAHIREDDFLTRPWDN